MTQLLLRLNQLHTLFGFFLKNKSKSKSFKNKNKYKLSGNRV